MTNMRRKKKVTLGRMWLYRHWHRGPPISLSRFYNPAISKRFGNLPNGPLQPESAPQSRVTRHGRILNRPLLTGIQMLNLPAELTLSILSYLPLNSLSQLQSVCKSWSEFCTLHEGTIYRNAACLHTYIPCPTTMLNGLSSLYSERVLKDVKTWKDLCMCSNQMSA